MPAPAFVLILAAEIGAFSAGDAAAAQEPLEASLRIELEAMRTAVGIADPEPFVRRIQRNGAVAARTASERPVEITRERIGPLDASMVPTTETLRRLFPSARVERFETEGIGGFEDGGEGWRISDGDDEVMIVLTSAPDRE